MDEGIIELLEAVILIFVFVRCAKFTVESKIRQGGYFWLASALIILAMIRREMSFLMRFDISFFGYEYAAIEDAVLLGIYVSILWQLFYARIYFINILKDISKETYLLVIILVETQYIGEHLHFSSIPHWVGFLMEELSENLVYLIALGYLWRFDLTSYEEKLVSSEKNNYRYLDRKNV